MAKKRFCIGKMPAGINDFIAEGRVVQDKMSNPVFNLVNPTPAMVIANLDQLEVYQAEKLAHNTANLPARNQMMKATRAMMALQVAQVNIIANGDEAILALSGFALNKVPAPKPIPEQGKVLGVENLNEGEVIIHYKGDPNCKVHEIEVKGPNAYNRKEISLFTKVKMSNLPVGVTLRVRVCGRNNKGEGVWSNYYNFVSNIVAANEDEATN